MARFTPVTLADRVTLDYDRAEQVAEHHYAFLVSEQESDAAFARIQDRGITYFADPGCQQDGEIYRSHGRRGTYFRDPDGHLMEILTPGLARVAAVIDRTAADVDELGRARRVQDLTSAAVLPDPRAERRRRLAEPDLEFRAFCARKGLPASSTLQLERAWDAWQAERYQRGETGQRPGYAGNPFRPR